jgi:hypothetical protein
METAIQYIDQINNFVNTLLRNNRSVEIQTNRRFVRVLVNGDVMYFVEKNTKNIYGAKSSTQYNPRRFYGTLETVDQFNWTDHQPLENSEMFDSWWDREASILSSYKKRGRPRKVIAP